MNLVWDNIDMVIKSISIKNFKSIDEISLDIEKCENSYTRMLVGVNESGKSNILEAMSYFATPTNDFNYYNICNQKNENSKVDLVFKLIFQDHNMYLEDFRRETGLDAIDFEINNIQKNVYLEKNIKNFYSKYNYTVNIKCKLAMKKSIETKSVGSKTTHTQIYKFFINENIYGAKAVTTEFFIHHFGKYLEAIIEKYEPKVSFWQPPEKYLISSCDLNEFSKDINSNIPIKNIFRLSGYDKDEDIASQINNISVDGKRSKLVSIMNEKVNKHIKKVWKHNIDIVIEISENGKFTLLIRDSGENNQHDRFKIDDRSEGAKHFLSLILSLSIEAEKRIRKNQLILIDEPENHLHPSGIRDMRDELLRIGKENCLFVSTHSPFLIDRTNKERNIIVKKNDKAQTIIKEIKEDDDIRGDEVLREAFGINVYQDLLNPQRILLEGASDKKILDKIFQIKNKEISTTNGNGSNIDTTASMFNQNDISIIVIVDDDEAGKKYKEKILKIGGVYSKNNVFTLKDLVPSMVDGGTIEDLLGKEYIESKFKKFCKNKYNEELEINLEGGPFVEQLKAYLHRAGKEVDDNLLDDFKARISNDLSLSKTTLGRKFPLLDELYQNIDEKLKMKDAD